MRRGWSFDNAVSLVAHHDTNNPASEWFFESAYLFDEVSTSGGMLIERMLKFALSPQPEAPSPATCLEVLHDVKKKLLVRKSERIRVSMLKRHAALQRRMRVRLCKRSRNARLVLSVWLRELVFRVDQCRLRGLVYVTICLERLENRVLKSLQW